MSEPERGWTVLSSGLPDLFSRLREVGPAEVLVRFSIGTEARYQVEVPGCRTAILGRLALQPGVDRFNVHVSGWGQDDFAWFGRRKGRGCEDYWQGAVEYRPEGRPALVVYFTAPLDGLEIRVRRDGETER